MAPVRLPLNPVKASPLFRMTQNLSAAEQALRDAAREYHRNPSRGKISVTPTKPLSNQRDLSLAYSPGVAYPAWTSRPTLPRRLTTPRAATSWA